MFFNEQMLEVRRDAYVRPDGGPDEPAIDRLATAAAAIIDGFDGG